MLLREAQADFLQAVFNKDYSAIAPHLCDVRGMEIYRNNVYAALTKALQGIHPVILRLVGEPFFKFTARQYIDRYPSSGGDLNHYGEHFAKFLGEFQAAAQLVYLPDVARLEWYCHRAYLAAEDSALNMQKLAAIPPERYGELRFSLSSSSHLLRSSWPIDTIWRVNQDNYSGDQTVNLDKGGVALLIQRIDNEISLLPLDKAEWSFLSGIAAKQSLETLFERVLSIDPDADVGVLLQKFVARETLAAFSLSIAR